MIKVAIKSIGKTFSINKEKQNCNLYFDKSSDMTFESIVSNKKKKQFYKRTTLLSLYAINDAIKNAGIDLNNYDRNHIGLYSFEKDSNNINISDTYKKLIKFCLLSRTANEKVNDVFSKCYNLSDLFKIMPNLSNHLISAELDIRGANKTLLTGEGTDLQSLIDASVDIHENRLEMIFCGSSISKYSVLETKQMAKFYNYNLLQKEIKESSVYAILGGGDDASLFLRGGRSFYLNTGLNLFERNKYLKEIFIDFFNLNTTLSMNEIDLVLYIDQYSKPSTLIETEILKKSVFTEAHFVVPNLEKDHNICNGMFYLSLLYNNVFDFENALVIQKNYNNIINFILITK